jgi:hypothetical protein
MSKADATSDLPMTEPVGMRPSATSGPAGGNAVGTQATAVAEPARMRPLQPLVVLSMSLLVFGFAAYHCAALASNYDVTIDTSALSATDSTLAFDFVSGGAFANKITIADFSTNGTLGANGPNSGSVTGAFPGTVTLSDASFFNEYLQSTTLGSKISFQLNATANGPTSGSLPDTFSFFLLDPTAGHSLLTTSDPAGADSLFSLQIDGSPLGIVAS